MSAPRWRRAAESVATAAIVGGVALAGYSIASGLAVKAQTITQPATQPEPEGATTVRKIVNGKVYDTATATRICDVASPTNDRGNFHWHDTDLYRTKRGAFFIAGRGGAASMWATPVDNGSQGGDGIRVVDEDEARAIMERAGCDEAAFRAAGLAVEEG